RFSRDWSSDVCSSDLHRIIERARPAARCTSLSLPLVAAAGIVPGGGQLLTPGRRAFGQTLLLATVGSFAAAQGLHAYSRSAYDSSEERRVGRGGRCRG